MRRLTYLYLVQHWKRDAALLAMMPVVAIAIYIFYRYNGSYTGLGSIRHRVAQWWVLGSMIYASTLFADYTSARTAYSGLLLPEQAWKKYTFAIGRSLVVFPLLSALLLLGADLVVVLTGRISGFTLRHASTLAECMTYTSLPLYHMPVMPYYLVTFVALITLIRSAAGRRQVFTVIAVAVVAVLVVTWGPGSEEYPVRTVYPFLVDAVTVAGRWKGVWAEPVVGTCMPMKAVEILSCLWLLLVPAGAYITAYFNFKESTLRR